MTAQKHTPGPWRVEERGSYFGVYTDDGRIVAQSAKPHRRALPNAHLIAAAPEMLEALRQVKGQCQEFLPHGLDQEICDALNKAEGRT